MTKYMIELDTVPASSVELEGAEYSVKDGDLTIRGEHNGCLLGDLHSFARGHWLSVTKKESEPPRVIPGPRDDGLERFLVDCYTDSKGGRIVGPVVMLVHKKGTCKGEHCVIHDPSDHHMKDWPLNWRADRSLMERICDHGVGHPDPDDIEYKRLTVGPVGAGVVALHGCDGCCRLVVGLTCGNENPDMPGVHCARNRFHGGEHREIQQKGEGGADWTNHYEDDAVMSGPGRPGGG